MADAVGTLSLKFFVRENVSCDLMVYLKPLILRANVGSAVRRCHSTRYCARCCVLHYISIPM